MADYPVPTKAGLYLAKTREYQWWNLIVYVQGVAPFLYCETWDRSVTSEHYNRIVKGSPPDKIVWGPLIEEPE